MQVTTLKRDDWERALGAPAHAIASRLRLRGTVCGELIFHANPRVKRVVFICAPQHLKTHRRLSNLVNKRQQVAAQ